MTVDDRFELFVSAEFAFVFVFDETDLTRPIDKAKFIVKLVPQLTTVPVFFLDAVEKVNDVKRNVDKFS